MRIISSVKHRYAILLKFLGKLLTSLTKLALEAKANLCSTIKKKNFYIPVRLESINFTTDPLTFQNRHINGAHFILDLKRP